MSRIGHHFTGWRKRAALLALCTLGLMGALVVSLRTRANPWRLDLVVPSGYRESDYAFVGGGPERTAGLSPDERLLAVGKPNSQIEVWDLATGRLQATLDKALQPEDGDHPALGGAENIEWFPDSRRLAVRRQYRWQVFDLAGNETPVPDPDLDRLAKPGPLPEKPILAMRGFTCMRVVDLAAGTVPHKWTLTHINGGQGKIDWTNNARFLLLNDLLGIRVWDVTSGKPVFFHRELDLALPPPHIADDNSGSDAQDARLTGTRPKDVEVFVGSRGSRPTSQVAFLVDSCFSLDGKFVISLYSGDLAGNPWPAASTNRLRFYETATGTLLWDHELPLPPRSMALSPDGSRLYVLSVVEESPRPTSILHIYDVAARSLVRQVALGRNFPSHIRPMPDNRWVVAYGGELWLFDTLEQCAPQRLPGSPNVCDVFVTADGKSVIEVGKDKTVRLWRQRREMSPLGAWGLPETWGLCGLSLVLCLGPVVIAGRDKARTLGAALPKPLWVLVVLGAMGIASSVTGDVLSYATDPFYASSQDNLGLPTALARTAFGILGLMSLLGIMRLRRGWYIFQIVLTSLGLLLVGAVLAVVASGSLGPGSTAATVSRHGYLLQMSIPRAIAVLAGGMVWASTELVLLLLPSVRAAFYGRRQDTSADVQA